MRTIWKFPVPFSGGNIIMPKGAKVLTLQMQYGVPTLWAEVDPDATIDEIHHLVVYGTGHLIDPGAGNYLGTFQEPPFVWHAYDTIVSPQAHENTA